MQRRRRLSERDTHFGRRGTRGAVKSQMRCVRRVAQRSRRAVTRLTRRTMNVWLRAETRAHAHVRERAPSRQRDPAMFDANAGKTKSTADGEWAGAWECGTDRTKKTCKLNKSACVALASRGCMFIVSVRTHEMNSWPFLMGEATAARVNERYLGMTHKHRPRSSPPLSLRPRST